MGALDRFKLGRQSGPQGIPGEDGAPGAPGAPGATGAAGVGPTGSMAPFCGRVAPTGHEICDGAAISRTTFAALMAVIMPDIGTATFNAATDVVTCNAHGLQNGDVIHFRNSGGALPTGLSAETRYAVAGITTNTFTLEDLNLATPVLFSTNGTGTTTLVFSPFGNGDGSTTFNKPDMRGRAPFGADKLWTATAAAGRIPNWSYVQRMGYDQGDAEHVLAEAELPGHVHSIGANSVTRYGSGSGAVRRVQAPNTWSSSATFSPSATEGTTESTGSDEAHNNMPPFLLLNWIIKT